MKFIALLLALPLWILISCGESTSPVEEKNLQNKRNVDTPQKEDGLKESVDPPSDKNTITGEVAPEGGESAPGKLTLISLPDNRIEGSFQIAQSEYLVSGMNESGNIRLWVTQKNKDADNIKRGLLEGSPKDGSFAGTFSVSGNGGEPLVKGTWKTDGVF